MSETRREPKKVLVRLDPAVHEAIAKWAADELRSINSQIEFALRLALKQVGRTTKPSAEE
ncbi:Arc family DNA-binding protein [Acrocarpospora catenulata]|uniref:Arc family DNA-binding protein n=1 Tax=Acrocarpospora catenulata TaxID=2836182 RepID=UPI001BDB5DFA|nr:Arc family DNA-binding protein [Acrocarpospora catenulata]